MLPVLIQWIETKEDVSTVCIQLGFCAVPFPHFGDPVNVPTFSVNLDLPPYQRLKKIFFFFFCFIFSFHCFFVRPFSSFYLLFLCSVLFCSFFFFLFFCSSVFFVVFLFYLKIKKKYYFFHFFIY